MKATKPDDSHFEPESEEFLDELIIEDTRRARRRRISAIVTIVFISALVAAAVIAGYQWTQTRYYVGTSDGTVAIYRGIQQDLGPIALSSVYRETTVSVDDLSAINQQRIEKTISADDLADAERIVSHLTNDSSN